MKGRPRGGMLRKGRYVGLFDKLGRALADRAKPTLKPVPTPEDPQAVLAPVTGRAIALGDVGDPAFSGGMLGVGLGIAPAGDVAYAPVTGVVAAAFDQIAGGNEKLTPFGGDHRPQLFQVLRHPGVAAEIRLCGKWTGNARITPCRQTEMGIADHGKPK